jgi:hypothetical protein
MKRTNIRRQGFITALALCAVAVGIAAAAPWTRGLSQTSGNPPPARKRIQTSVFGLQTLARNQSLRLSVVNTGLNEPPDPSTPGENEPPDPNHRRRVTLAFDIYGLEPPEPSHAGDGAVRNLRIVRRESRTFMLRPGQAATFEFEATRPNETVGAWVLNEPPDPATPGEAEPPEPNRSAVSTSLEVRQGNSTQFVLPGTTRGFNPQPDPPRDR